MKDALETVPRFLKQAAGLQEKMPVVVTFYGGKDGGSHHLRWRDKKDGGGAQPVVWDEALRQEVEARMLAEEKVSRREAADRIGDRMKRVLLLTAAFGAVHTALQHDIIMGSCTML